jgi:glycosyltransferase involved in cell wall biosynthesis
MIPQVSVVIPAHNEAEFLPTCLAAMESAAKRLGRAVEIVVVLNRCTDATESIARTHGCRIVREDAKNLSLIRNAGVAATAGEVVVTCDADSRIHPDSFVEIVRRLEDGKTVGGGALVLPERWSLGIVASGLAVLPYLALSGVSFGLFWFLRRDFEAIGGFDPRWVSVEDVDFAQRLKAYGRQSGRSWGTLMRAPLITSCRKFDQFGDWYLFLNPGFVRKVFRGTDRAAADQFWYDVRSE